MPHDMPNTARQVFDAEVLPRLEQSRQDWLLQARAVAWELGQGGTIVTVDDVRRRMPPPEGIDPRVMGAVFRRSQWQIVGTGNSNRRACHGRAVCRFRLREG